MTMRLSSPSCLRNAVRDDVLQRLQAFAAAADENAAVLALEIDARAFRRLLDVAVSVTPMAFDDVSTNSSICAFSRVSRHDATLSRAPLGASGPAFFSRRSAGGRTVLHNRRADQPVVKYCCPMPRDYSRTSRSPARRRQRNMNSEHRSA